jgi:hypothetical protein
MKVVLQSEGQDAFILEGEGGEECFYLLDRRAKRRFGPASQVRLTRHGRWHSFAGPEAHVLDLFAKAEEAPLER